MILYFAEGEIGGNIKRQNLKKLGRTFTSIICLVVAAFMFLGCNDWILYAFLPSLLFYIAFSLLGSLQVLTKPFPKNTHPVAKACIIFVCLIIGCSRVKAIIPTINIQDTISPMINKTINKELENVFGKYNTKTFEDLPNLNVRACSMELRFTYILTQINKIEETNANIDKRFTNLVERDRILEKNINKVNKRARNAHSDLLILNRPNIYPEKVNLTQSYNRMSLWGKTINKNIEDPQCSTNCAFSHIDQSSFCIVEEIDEIHIKQDKINLILASLEKTYDNLELKQRQAEQNLTARGF